MTCIIVWLETSGIILAETDASIRCYGSDLRFVLALRGSRDIQAINGSRMFIVETT